MNTHELDLPDAPRVLSLKPVPNGGCLVALADVEIPSPFGPQTYVALPVFKSPNKYSGEIEVSVSPPKKEWTRRDGTIQRDPLVHWHPDLRRAITKAVSEAYESTLAHFEPEPTPTRPSTGYQGAESGNNDKGNSDRYGNSGGYGNGRSGGHR